MAKVVNRSQQVVTAGLRPESAYSRIVTIEHVHPQPPGQDFAVTAVLANVLRLLSVDVWMTGSGLPVATTWWFDLRRGFQLPTRTLQIQQWDYLLPVRSTVGLWIFNGYGNPVHRHWDMNVVYKGASQRFAIIGSMAGPALARVTASFRISEG